MPGDIARVMKRYDDLQAQWQPLLDRLTSDLHDYVMRMDSVAILETELQELLRAMGASGVDHPKAADHVYVKSLVRDIKKHRLLAEDGLDTDAHRQTADLIPRVAELQRDVAAVARSTSGFFSPATRPPELGTLSEDLLTFVTTLHEAAAGG